MEARTFMASLGVLAILGLLGYGLLSKGEARVVVGQATPDKTLARLDGAGQGRIADYRGKWVLVNLWASWCEPCEAESPALEKYAKSKRKQELIVLGINVQDNSDDARAFVNRFNLTYPQLRSIGDDRSSAFGATGLPESFLVNPEGRLVLIRRGAVDATYLDRFVTPFLERQT